MKLVKKKEILPSNEEKKMKRVSKKRSFAFKLLTALFAHPHSPLKREAKAVTFCA